MYSVMILEKYLINKSSSIREALVALNNQSGDAMTLFVVDDMNQLVGTLTDGDIRRGLIAGLNLDSLVTESMREDFFYVFDSNIDVRLFSCIRKKGVKLVPILNAEKQIVDIVNLKKEKSYLPIDAVLMAGGKGERLRPLTERTPKPLLKVGEKCIIDYNIDSLVSYGVKHISVTVNYLREQIETHFLELRNGVRVNCIREPKYLGTIGSIKFVDAFFNDTVLVMNSDLFTNIDYEDFYLHFKEHDAEMSVAAVPYTISVPYGIFDLDGRDIKGLLEKPKYNYYANAGIYLIKKSTLAQIPQDTFFNATDLIEKLITQNKKVIRYPLNGTWIDIGNPQEYAKAQDLVKHL